MKIISLIFCVLISIVIISCEKGFEPKAEFREDYFLYSVINADTNYQTVILSKSYDVEGFNPLNNEIDPDIKDAEVTLIRNGNRITLRDTNVVRSNTDNYSTPQYFYYINNFKPNLGDEIEIEAKLKNGKILKSKTTIPSYSLFFVGGEILYPKEEQLTGNNEIVWKLNNPKDDYIFAHRLFINYYDNNAQLNRVQVPLRYDRNSDGNEIAFYPRVSNETKAIYDTSVVNRILNEIEPDTLSRNSITILNGEVEVNVMDENFGSYVNTIETFNDGFSIQVYENNFSNIEGGFGIFGSYITKKQRFTLCREFILPMGFRSINTEDCYD